MKAVLSIAASDSSGGAGIQADVKTMMSHGVYGMSVITAVTAQNTCQVSAYVPMETKLIEAQLFAVLEDIPPDAVKIGILPDIEAARCIGEILKKYKVKNIVIDPVMAAGTGVSFIKQNMQEYLETKLYPSADLITPNIPEAETFWGEKIESVERQREAAKVLSAKWKTAVLVKGGHMTGEAVDILAVDGKTTCFSGERMITPDNHGTGCTLSSAIACNLAVGYCMEESIRKAKNYLNSLLSMQIHLGQGCGPLHHCLADKQKNTCQVSSSRL